MTSLYICYQSLLDPLTQTQVVAYLEGLVQSGCSILLLTFEPRPLSNQETEEWRRRMDQKGISWHWLPYHKRPTAPATAWDTLAGIITGAALIRRHNVQLVHARAHVPGLMGLALKRLTGIKLLLDIRGFLAEEYVDAGNWPAGGRLYRLTKFAERALVRAADGIVVLTHAATDLLRQWYPDAMEDKLLKVIPCCVDLRHAPSPEVHGPEISGRSPSVAHPGGVTFSYVGKLGGWYLTEETVALVAVAAEMLPALRWSILTQSDPAPLRDLIDRAGLGNRVTIGRVPPEQLPDELKKTDVGLALIKPCLSKLASSPTKIGEYLAAGTPVISTAGIGDLDALLSGQAQGGPVGVILRECTLDCYRDAVQEVRQLLEDPDIRPRCRRVAEEELDLVKVGWPRYRAIYRALLGESWKA